eukprot:c19548_g3_i4.p1 GENE.c19548_g3_i4~~c19548_g3_i4.p1  ORF type:complete len:741 (+),score=132.83 c19548_g3_i4:39-2261(+)
MAIALPLAVCRKLLLSIDTPVCVRCENQPDRTLLCLVKPMTQGLGVARACLLDAQHTITEDNADLLTGSDFYNIQVWHALEEREVSITFWKITGQVPPAKTVTLALNPSLCNLSADKVCQLVSRLHHTLHRSSSVQLFESTSDSTSPHQPPPQGKTTIVTVLSVNPRAQFVRINAETRLVTQNVAQISNFNSVADAIQQAYVESQTHLRRISTHLSRRIAIQSLSDLVFLPLLFPQHFKAGTLKPPKGMLLHGPPGVGKSHIVREFAAQTNIRLLTLDAIALASPIPGVPETALRNAFAIANSSALPQPLPDYLRLENNTSPKFASEYSPNSAIATVLFLDGLEAVHLKRLEGGGSSGEARAVGRVVTQLLTLMDGLEIENSENNGKSALRLVVVAATSNPNELDPALRRPGRLDVEVSLSQPNALERFELLVEITREMKLAEDLNLMWLADSTPGFTAGDLTALCRQAASICLESSPAHPHIQFSDFEQALSHVRPSVSRADILTAKFGAPSFSKLGGLHQVRLSLERALIWPLTRASDFKRFNIRPSRGVLLFGPPGCAKTTAVRAACSEAKVPLVTCSAASLYSSFVGDTEAELRGLFEVCRRMGCGCVLFLDEVDALAGKRESVGQGEAVRTRLLATLLNEMDGVSEGGGIVVVAATNRPWAVDSALLRPGRFDDLVFVGAPNLEDRVDIFRACCSGKPIDTDVDFQYWAEKFVPRAPQSLLSLSLSLCLKRVCVC